MQAILVGPGHSLLNFRHHLTGSKCHGLVPQPEGTKSSSAVSSKATKTSSQATSSGSHADGADARPPAPTTSTKCKQQIQGVVEKFLTEMGLTSSLADALRHVGISDEARMKALGKLPDSGLDRLEKTLAEQGLDFSACLLVREGLKQRATAS